MRFTHAQARAMGGVLAEAAEKIATEQAAPKYRHKRRRRTKLLNAPVQEPGVGTYSFRVPDWHPATINTLLSAHPMRRSLLKRADAALISFYGVTEARIPRARGMRRVRLTIVLGPGERGADPDAYWKSLLDGMVLCGLLLDDRKECVATDPVQYASGPERATVVEVIDL